MWELDHKEGWAPKNWCLWIVVLDKTLESPLDCKEIKPVSSKGNQSWSTGRTDAFELCCWRRLLRVPWRARRSNQSVLKEISPEYSLEGLMLKLKLKYFAYLMQKADSVEKTPMMRKNWGGGGDGDDRGWDGWMASPTQWTWVWASSGRQWTGKPSRLWGGKESDMTEQLN